MMGTEKLKYIRKSRGELDLYSRNTDGWNSRNTNRLRARWGGVGRLHIHSHTGVLGAVGKYSHAGVLGVVRESEERNTPSLITMELGPGRDHRGWSGITRNLSSDLTGGGRPPVTGQFAVHGTRRLRGPVPEGGDETAKAGRLASCWGSRGHIGRNSSCHHMNGNRDHVAHDR